MSLTRTQSDVILRVLDAATDGNWPRTVAALRDGGNEPRDVIDAWKQLEKDAGCVGMSPDVEDFNQ